MRSNMNRHTLALGTALALSLSGAALAQTEAAATATTGQISSPSARPFGSPKAPSPKARAKVSNRGIEDVIVTARRVNERLQDVPISIKVFNQKQLSNRNVVTASDLATYTPSLTTNNNFGTLNTTFAIRGFVQDIGTQPSVGTYFADVVAPRGASPNIPAGDGLPPGSFYDLQNVQVLKGPQGTLFGRNTTGGAILLVPQKPTSEYGGYIEASTGNYGERGVQAVLNVPISSNVRLRVDVDHEVRDGYEKNDSGTGPSRFGDIDYLAFRGSLVWDVTPDIENYTIFSYNTSDTNGDIQKLVGCNPSTSFTNILGILACDQLRQEKAKGAGFYTVQNGLPNPETLLHQWQIINTTTWLASDNLTIKNIGSYAQLNEQLSSSLFGTNFDLHNFLPTIFKKGTVIDFAEILPPPGGYSANESTFSEELQAQGRLPTLGLTYQGGFYAELTDPIGTVGSVTPVLLACSKTSVLDCANPIGAGSINDTVGRTRFNDFGVYAQATYSITDQLKLTGGARYTWDTETEGSQLTSLIPTKFSQVPTTDVTRACVDPTSRLPDCNINARESTRAPTWLVDLDYKPFRNLLLYVKDARGYRAGGLQAQLPGFESFQAERVNTYEIGVKESFLGALKGSLDVDGFYNDFGNQQLQVGFLPKPGSVVSQASGVINAGKSSIYGLEVDASIAPFPNFVAAIDYTYLQTDLLRVTQPVTAASNPYFIADQLAAGDPLTLTPRNKLSLSGTYTLPIDSRFGTVSFGAIYTYIGTQVSNFSDQLAVGNPAIVALQKLQARNLLNLNVNWASIAGSNFDLTLFATNVTQDKYYTIVPGLYAGTGFETASLGEPAFYGAKLRYRFGL